MGHTWALYGIVAYACLGGLLFGYDIGVVSGVKTNEQFLTQFNITYHIDSDDGYPTVDDGSPTFLVECFVSSLLLGCFFGALAAQGVADHFGRKWTIWVASVLFCAATAWAAASDVFWPSLIPARFVCGISVGALSFIVPLYVAELAPEDIRGKLGAMQQLAIVTGILLAFLVNIGLLNVHHPVDNGWRYSIAAAGIFGIALAVGSPFLPESPRWLLQHKGRIEAYESLLATRSQQQAEIEIEAMEIAFADMRNELKHAPGWCKVLRETFCFHNTSARRIRIAAGIQILQQLTGVNVIFYFAPEIFSDISTGIDPLIPTAITGVVNLIATLFALHLVEAVGRRTLFLAGAVIMGVSVCVVGILTAACDFGSNKIAGYSCMVFILVFIVGFAISWGPLGWLYPSEIFPQATRGKGMAISTASNWVMNFAIGLGALSLFNATGAGFWFIIGGIQVFIFIFSYFLILETRGKTLEEVDLMFARFEGEDTVLLGRSHTSAERRFDALYPHPGDLGGGVTEGLLLRRGGSSVNAAASSLPPVRRRNDEFYYV